jgi:hypothetical protein
MHDIDMMLKLQLEGRHDEARAISDKLEALGPDKVTDLRGNVTQDIWFRHCFNRGWFTIQDGDYQNGCRLLEHGRFLNVYGNGPLKTDAPIYNPEQHDIKGKSIIVSLEGGLGDEIIHSRFATSFKKLGAAKVYLAAAPELVSIFSRIEGVDGVILRNEAHKVQHDYWVPGFSAGWVAGHDFTNFPSKPYLTPKPDSVQVWKTMINSDKIKVGIRWAGNPKFEHQQFRRFPEKFITNLSKYKEIQLFSLQRDANIIDLPKDTVDLQHLLLSWEDTLAAIANLDIVITSCTSIAHAAAAIGKTTWVVVPILPYHTWTPYSPNSKTSPYYDCVTIFRQKKAQKWNDTWQDLYATLEEKFDLHHVDMPNEDRIVQKLNMGCGFKHLDGFVNADKSSLTNPNLTIDFENIPWLGSTGKAKHRIKDNEYDHIVAKDILEYLGKSNENFIDIIKEMYRVSNNGAIWEIQTPHWRCDASINDPTQKRVITPAMLQLFNRKHLIEQAKMGETNSYLAFEHGVDIEVCDVQFEYTKPYADRIRSGNITEDELMHSLNHLNNVALSTRILVQVHKPFRYTEDELWKEINATA